MDGNNVVLMPRTVVAQGVFCGGEFPIFRDVSFPALSVAAGAGVASTATVTVDVVDTTIYDRFALFFDTPLPTLETAEDGLGMGAAASLSCIIGGVTLQTQAITLVAYDWSAIYPAVANEGSKLVPGFGGGSAISPATFTEVTLSLAEAWGSASADFGASSGRLWCWKYNT